MRKENKNYQRLIRNVEGRKQYQFLYLARASFKDEEKSIDLSENSDKFKPKEFNVGWACHAAYEKSRDERSPEQAG